MGEGATDVVDIVDLTDTIDDEHFGTAGFDSPNSGTPAPAPAILAATEDSCFILVTIVELIQAVDGTLGTLGYHIFPTVSRNCLV